MMGRFGFQDLALSLLRLRLRSAGKQLADGQMGRETVEGFACESSQAAAQVRVRVLIRVRCSLGIIWMGADMQQSLEQGGDFAVAGNES
jgi:hypothetical protein